MSLPNVPTTTSSRRNFWPLFWVLVCLHQLYFGWFLVRSDFVPYVMDGNETFSVWWHAHNLYTFDFWKSFGLTDESYGLTEASHPFFHTHQGNMPRLFGFLIYALGARTVEAQVLITTLVIGNLTLFFCYASIAKITRPALAFVFCLFLFSDYLLYAQWHVVTYRVWYGFLFFGTLFAISHAKDRIWPYALLGLLFFLLFYFELVFAVYVSIATALWALWLHWGSPKRIAKLYGIQLVASIAALVLLFTQLVLVFGLDVVKADFSTTFLARNASTANTYGSVEAFFRSHNIVFWNNFRDGESLRTSVALVRSLGFYIFQVWTPVFFILIAVPLLGLVISFVGGCDRRNAAANSEIVHDWKTRSVMGPLLGFGVVVILALMAVMLPRALFGIVPPRGPEIIGAIALVVTIAGSLSLLLAGWAGGSHWIPIFRGILTVSLGAVLILKSHILYDQTYSDIWVPLYQDWGVRLFLRVATIVAFVVAAGIAVMGASASFGQKRSSVARALIFLGIGFIAYTSIYVLSPGYVQSGYAERYAPFAIFFVAMTPAIAIYAMIIAAQRLGQGLFASGSFRSDQRRIVILLLFGIAIAVPAGLWTSAQVYYARLFPPDHLAFLKNLKLPPLHGATFAVDNYAAPVAYYAGNWAYFDTVIAADAGLSDPSSRWFADWKSNDRYAYPDYYLCMRTKSFASVLLDRSSARQDLPFRFCRDERIFREEESSLSEPILSDFAEPKFWSAIAFYGGRPKIEAVSIAVSFVDEHWAVTPTAGIETNLARPPFSTEFELRALPYATSCKVKGSNLKVIQESRDSFPLALPHGFRGVFLVRARAGADAGMGRWKSGDLWMVEAASAGPPARCPQLTTWGKSEPADLTVHQKGWGDPEPWGVWTIAPEATLRPFPVSDIPADSDILLEATVRGFVPKPGGVQKVTVRANGIVVADWALTDTKPEQEVSARIAKGIMIGSSNLVLTFDIANPTSPASVARSSDNRELGMGLIALKLKKPEQ